MEQIKAKWNMCGDKTRVAEILEFSLTGGRIIWHAGNLIIIT
jgi:hypothetical protein